MGVAVRGTLRRRSAVDRSQTIAESRPLDSVPVGGSRSPAPRCLSIAMIGTRGVPPRYGGFETAIEEIGRRLVHAGHRVTVYCRRARGGPDLPDAYLGMKLVTLPALRLRYTETLSHSALASLHAVLARQHDVAFVFNSANAVFLPLLRARGVPVAVHVDGLEWRRSKWAGIGRHYYRVAEALAVRWADALIADAPGVADYYDAEFGASTERLSYGATVLRELPDDRLAELGAARGRFHLLVARVEPENQLDVVLRGYGKSAAAHPLIVVGGAPYRTDYMAELEAIAATDPRVRLLGPLWDQELLNQLYGHALLCLHGHSVGGTNPSLLRAMGAGAAVAAYDVRYNRDVLGPRGWFFGDEAGVARVVEAAERDPGGCRRYGSALQRRIAARYRWEDVVEGYSALALRLSNGYSRRGEATGGRRRPGG